MHHSKAIKCILKRSGLEQKDLAQQLGLAITTLNMRVNKSFSLHCILELLDAVGYEMVAMPKDGSPLPEDTYVLQKEDYP